jgi:hypothetical protein
MPSPRPGRRTARTLSIIFGVLVVVGVIGASPWFLRAFDGSTTRWERLSFIGQT